VIQKNIITKGALRDWSVWVSQMKLDERQIGVDICLQRMIHKGGRA
jgi:hypothetical protein